MLNFHELAYTRTIAQYGSFKYTKASRKFFPCRIYLFESDGLFMA